MLHRLLNRLSYANVVATIALFVALGGTSYAALKLPKNSVGSAQIKTGAVHTGEIADRTIRLGDISLSARGSLRGQTGAQGAQGKPGVDAIKHFAVLNSGGVRLRGDATSGGSAGGVGNYTVGFAEPISGCAYSATLGTADGSKAPAGRITVNDQGGAVGVQTYDASGAPADLGFHLIVAC
ncbi:MAG TPA: hypothetical protein VFG42_11470 [Baekduia sp.]|nr:hypothetical protein [Baekduia sp.]